MFKKALFIFICIPLCCSFCVQSAPLNASYATLLPTGTFKGNFPSINEEEERQDWVREYRLGQIFAKERELDLALNAFKRALVLVPNSFVERKNEIQYALLYTHYLKEEYTQFIQSFEKSSLLYAQSSFVAYHDLLLMLYDSYEKVQSKHKADLVLERIYKEFPKEGEQLLLSQALTRKDLSKVAALSEQFSKLSYLLDLSQNYQKKMKSPKLAKWLGVLCPGAGYLYAGQPKSATTSFLVNGLLIAASVQLFIAHFYTLGLLTATFEAGWYIGGILGSKAAVKSYNNQLYQDFTSKVTLQENLIIEERLNYEF